MKTIQSQIFFGVFAIISAMGAFQWDILSLIFMAISLIAFTVLSIRNPK